ncbi:hypothetical protein HDU96_001908 [Phlyctochytrium bullatum]|nr:hypothetical protein HDU96_001908 [Phlyctochytrium bullatum]
MSNWTVTNPDPWRGETSSNPPTFWNSAGGQTTASPSHHQNQDLSTITNAIADLNSALRTLVNETQASRLAIEQTQQAQLYLNNQVDMLTVQMHDIGRKVVQHEHHLSKNPPIPQPSNQNAFVDHSLTTNRALENSTKPFLKFPQATPPKFTGDFSTTDAAQIQKEITEYLVCTRHQARTLGLIDYGEPSAYANPITYVQWAWPGLQDHARSEFLNDFPDDEKRDRLTWADYTAFIRERFSSKTNAADAVSSFTTLRSDNGPIRNFNSRFREVVLALRSVEIELPEKFLLLHYYNCLPRHLQTNDGIRDATKLDDAMNQAVKVDAIKHPSGKLSNHPHQNGSSGTTNHQKTNPKPTTSTGTSTAPVPSSSAPKDDPMQLGHIKTKAQLNALPKLTEQEKASNNANNTCNKCRGTDHIAADCTPDKAAAAAKARIAAAAKSGKK